MVVSGIIKNITVTLFIAFLGWVSFFPEPVQNHYQIFTKIFLGLGFLSLLIRKESVTCLFEPEHLPLWIFLLCLSGNIFLAQNRQVAIRTYLDISLILVFLYYLANRMFSSDKYAYMIIKTICIFSFLVALFGIIEWFFGKNPIYEYIMDNPFYERYMNDAIRRPMSTQFNPVILGSFLLGCLPFSFVLIKKRFRFFCLIAIFSIIVNASVIILTRSRGVFLGMVALFLFYLWNKKKVFSVLFLVLVIIVVALCSRLDSSGFGRFGFRRLVFGSYDSIFSEYRFQRFSMTFNMVKNHPLFGIGLNHFRIMFEQYNTEKDKKISYEFMIADNMYLTLLSETGIIGFSGFLVFIFYLFKRGMMSLYILKDKKDKELLLIAMSALMGLLVNMGGYELFYWRSPFVLFCILCGIIVALSFHPYILQKEVLN